MICSDIHENESMPSHKEHQECAAVEKLSTEPTITKKRKRSRIETKECGTQTSENEANNNSRTKISKKLKRIHEKLQKIIRQMVD